jgi:hypothetical protein
LGGAFAVRCSALLCCVLLCSALEWERNERKINPTEMIYMAGQRYVTTQDAHKIFKKSMNMGAILMQLWGIGLTWR